MLSVNFAPSLVLLAAAVDHPMTAPLPPGDIDLVTLTATTIEYVSAHPDSMENIATYIRRMPQNQRVFIVAEMLNASERSGQTLTRATLSSPACLTIIHEDSAALEEKYNQLASVSQAAKASPRAPHAGRLPSRSPLVKQNPALFVKQNPALYQ